jgi:NDP-sugar pyrophosphorylase family protein
MIKPALLVLAAGMGSRYGGLKQLDPVGPGGETLMDYSVYDAHRAGFGRVVFVIRRDFAESFRKNVGAKFEGRLPVDYVFQELDKLPPGFRVPAGRTKPWGTGQAILVAAETIHEPFAAINADDFYGANSFRALAAHLMSGASDYGMVGYVLRNTLSDHGTVSRGVCETGPGGYLQTVTEITSIERDGAGAKHRDCSGAEHRLKGDETVSMNFWGFTPALFSQLREQFTAFLKHHGNEEKSEFYIPAAVSALIRSDQAQVKVLPTPDLWFGVTYREDRPRVVESIRRLVEQGEYPAKLAS